MKSLLFFLITLILCVVVAASQVNSHFIGKVIAEWLDNPNGPDRIMRLTAPFAYVDPNGKEWQVPAGTEIDGASIPRFLWNTVGSPFTGDYRNASVIHDCYCDTKTENWKDVHRMFFDACVTGGVKTLKAKVMYAAVRAMGPRWGKIVTKGTNTSVTYLQTKKAYADSTQLAEISKWVERTNPSIEQINDTIESIVTVRTISTVKLGK